MQKKYLQIALNSEQQIVSIYNVESGLACNCYCPTCKAPLVAKNKNKTIDTPLNAGQKVAHFAHANGNDCPNAGETAIHLLAKEILLKEKSLYLPPLTKDFISLTKATKIIFDKVELEKLITINGITIKPDAIGYKKNTRLLIEFYKTHAVDYEKIYKIKAMNESCIEIDLNYIEPLENGQVNIDEIKKMLINNYHTKTWVHSTKTESLYNEYLRKKEIEDKQKEEAHQLYVRQMQQLQILEAEQLAKRLLAHKNNLINEGYKFLKVYGGNVYCPKLKFAGKKGTIELNNCQQCEFYKTIIYGVHGEEDNGRHIACGLANNKKNTKHNFLD
jgi:hypothetical protein